MDTLDIGKSDGIKSIPSYFSGGKKEEDEEEDIPDMDTYEETGDNLVGRSQLSILDWSKAKLTKLLIRSLPFYILITGCCRAIIFCRRRA